MPRQSQSGEDGTFEIIVVDGVESPGSDGDSRSDEASTVTTVRRSRESRRWIAIAVISVLALAGATILSTVSAPDLGDDDAAAAHSSVPATPTVAPTLGATVPETNEPTERMRRDWLNLVAYDYFEPPARGTVDRYAMRSGTRPANVFVYVLRGRGGTDTDDHTGSDVGALLVADATRRAIVRKPGPVSFPGGPLGDVPVRRSFGPDGSGLIGLEWDHAGYGWWLVGGGLTTDDLLAIGSIAMPSAGGSLITGTAPSLSSARLAEVGVGVTAVRSGTVAVVGPPLIGQSGQAGIKGLHWFGPGEGVSGSFALTASTTRVLVAADVRRALGSHLGVTVIAGRPATVLELSTDQRIGTRMNGMHRVLWDTRDGLTIELASDTVSAVALAGIGRTLDERRLLDALEPIAPE